MKNDFLLYYANKSNSSNRVIWVLKYKKIDFDSIDTENSNLDLSLYQNINPFLRVPTLIYKNIQITESMAISEFLEDLFPEPLLLSKDIILRAKIRELCEIINATFHPSINKTVIRNFLPNITSEEINEKRIKWLTNNFNKIEELLFKDSNYVIGQNFSLADMFVMSMYKKLLELDSNSKIDYLEPYRKFLLSQKEVVDSCPFSI